MVKQVTAVVIGAGNRGKNYADFSVSNPDKLRIVGVAEPRKFRRDLMRERFSIESKHVFTDWKHAAALDKFADSVIITTLDQMHKEPAVAFANKGYHILLEKPMAVTASDCQEIVKACKDNGVILAVGHVLRYGLHSQTIKDVIDSGAIGDVVNIQHSESIGFWHFAHSYVRGNWRRESETAFSLLAKCCHDFDLIRHWIGRRCEKVSSFGNLTHFTKENKVGFWHFAHSFVRGNWRNEKETVFSLLAKCCHDIDLINHWVGRRCVKVSSFGSLMHFTKKNKPEGASSRCLDCAIENQCPYSAKKIYLEDRAKQDRYGWPVSVITDTRDIESVTEALMTGPYGRCVYDCDNDVVSHQVVNMEFAGGVTASLTMCAFTQKVGIRETKVCGTKGEIRSDFGGPVEVVDFLTNHVTTYPCRDDPNLQLNGGHGSCDYRLIEAFVKAVAEDDRSNIVSGADETLASHLIVFAAEKARLENRVVMMEEFGI